MKLSTSTLMPVKKVFPNFRNDISWYSQTVGRKAPGIGMSLLLRNFSEFHWNIFEIIEFNFWNTYRLIIKKNCTRCCTCFRCLQFISTSAPSRMSFGLPIPKFSRSFKIGFLFQNIPLLICQLVKIPPRETSSGCFSIEKPNCKQFIFTIEMTTFGHVRYIS